MKLSSQQYISTDIHWEKLAWLDRHFTPRLQKLFPDHTVELAAPIDNTAIQVRLKKTALLGDLPLWEGYDEEKSATRRANLVSSNPPSARFFYSLARGLRPTTIVEFGTAVGISGMYWLSALKANRHGHLYTFEVNEKWADIAEGNLSVVSPRFTLTRGLFEEEVHKVVKKQIDICFIDGVHTSEWVKPEFELVSKLMRPGGIIIFDDITFSEDMESCWRDIVADRRVKRAFTVNKRVGVVQV